MGKKLPSFQFYPGDWMRDPALRMCSIEARGLWIDMLCIMHQSERYGHLVINGVSLTPKMIAKLTGIREKIAKKLIKELENFLVFSRDDDGTIFSRRMVSDEIERRKWRDRQHKHRNVTRDVTPMSLCSSSSSSSSVKNNPLTPLKKGACHDEKKKSKSNGKKQELSLPSWMPEEEWREWKNHRVRIKKPMTPKAESLCIAALQRLRESGDDPVAVLHQSILGGWQGVFALKPDAMGNGPVPKAGTTEEGRKRLEQVKAHIASLRGGDNAPTR